MILTINYLVWVFNADFSDFQKSFPNFELFQFDGFNFPNFEKKFNFALSNAVIEHVGPFDKQLEWLKSISVITELLFVTTPNKWLPFETHTHTFFFHWLPDKYRDLIYKKIGKEKFTNNYMWLFSEKKLMQLLHFAGYEIVYFKKNKFLFFTIDFVAVCRPLK